MTLDISGDVSPEIAFDLVPLVEDLADFYDIIVGKIIALEIERDARLPENFPRRAAPDPIDIGQRDFHSLGPR